MRSRIAVFVALAWPCLAGCESSSLLSDRADSARTSGDELSRRAVERRAVEAVHLGHAGGQLRAHVAGRYRRGRRSSLRKAWKLPNVEELN